MHFNIRLEDDRLCTLVMIGARPNGAKELLAVEDGYRESAESWKALLRDLKRRGMVAPAVGVAAHGDKQVLGRREGAAENAAAVRALLADLAERRLATTRALLIVIDGAKAPHKAVVEVLGAHALIQRCRENQKRNVTDALP